MTGIGAGIVALAFAPLAMAQTQAQTEVHSVAQVPRPSVDVSERIEYYVVRGETAHELVTQMRTRGPVASVGRRSWAFTAWEVRANYYLTPGEGGCAVTEPRAQLEMVTTLPRWDMSAGAPSRLRDQWERMIPHLMRHEQTHRAHAELAAQAAVRRLGELPVQADCPAADREVQRALRSAVAAARRLSLDYDHATHFGASEGVGLDPP